MSRGLLKLSSSIVLGLLLSVSVGVQAEKFIGTDIEDPESSNEHRLIESTLMQGKTLLQGAEDRLHETALSKHQKLIRRLTQSGMRVIMLGNIVRIVIPTAVFFEPGSVMVREDKAEDLATLHDFIARYPPSAIAVVGHSDFLGSEKQQLKFSNQAAQVIAGYLWANGINKDQLSIKGVGAKEPVTDSDSGLLNSRVEIVFRDRT